LLIVLLMTAIATVSSGCIATRKFTRNEVKTSSDTINARIDTTKEELNGEIKETQDSVDRVNTRVTGVDGRVTELDSKTTAGLNAVKTDVNSVRTEVGTVAAKTDRTSSDLAGLDQKFQNRNNFTVAAEKAVQFKFDSSKLEPDYTATLDEIAAMVMQNANAIIVLEGHTDATGNSEYNVRLGERRVDAVRQYLAVEKSVPVYRIHEVSFGSSKPIASNDSRDGREKNRAVTMTVLVPNMGQAAAANQ
jgi:outer membrane protein OmpA-like peptidoglycan-associated protein